MRRIYLMLLAAWWLGMGQLVVAQQPKNADPQQAPANQSKPSDSTYQKADPSPAISAPAGMAAATPIAPSTLTTEKPQAQKNQKKRPGDENDKNPYWEPRDWNYINNQGP
jgi:cytoskeletal protein RodZ